MFIDFGKIISSQGKKLPVMTARGELKKEEDRAEREKLKSRVWRRTEQVWTKKKHYT